VLFLLTKEKNKHKLKISLLRPRRSLCCGSSVESPPSSW